MAGQFCWPSPGRTHWPLTPKASTVRDVSRDIYVQDIPKYAMRASDIPDDWEPAPLPFLAERVIAEVRSLHPAADMSDPAWLQVDISGASIEVVVSDERPLMSFALHVRAANQAAADSFVSELLERLGVRAFDPEGAPESGIFGNG